MPYVPPRRVAATPTSVFVSNLPLWLPAKGSWGAVSVNDANAIRGHFPPKFPSTRDWGGINGLFADYSGGIWNPYFGNYGAMMFHGGGHASSLGMLDNGVYIWWADDQSWRRLTDPGPYPGDLTEFGDGTSPHLWGIPTVQDDLLGAQEPLKTYGEVKVGVPCSNHSRYNLSILPPSQGGGSFGSLVLPRIAAAHSTGNGGSNWGHRLDCASAHSLGSAAAYAAWSRFATGPNPHFSITGATSAASCVDTARGYVYQLGNSSTSTITRFRFGTGTYELCTPGNWGSFFGAHNSDQGPMIYAPERDCFIWMNKSYAIAVAPGVDAPANLSNLTAPAVTGTANRPSAATQEGSAGITWCKDLGSFGAIVCWDARTGLVHACYCPSNPVSGTWTWAVLSASNTPTPGNAIFWYHRFQYAPALKSFFLCSMPGDAYGGIVCFRPNEL